MKATFVRNLSDNTALFKCEPPMKFLYQHPEQLGIEVRESSLVVAWSGEIDDGFHRAVLHSAQELAGGEGVAYGAEGCRIFDAEMSHEQALAISGYKLEA